MTSMRIEEKNHLNYNRTHESQYEDSTNEGAIPGFLF